MMTGLSECTASRPLYTRDPICRRERMPVRLTLLVGGDAWTLPKVHSPR
jgi:hypothetical protein